MGFSSNVSVVIGASRDRVWEALTQPDLVKQYFFGTNLVTDWTVGGPLLFRGQWEGKSYEDRGTVLAFEPKTTFSFNYWSAFSGLEDKAELRQIIRYDLEDSGAGIKVTIHQSNVDTQERADHSAKNWRMVLDGLKALLERTATAPA